MWKTSTDPFAIVGAGLSRRAFNGPAMGARWSAVVFVDDDFDGEAFAAALAEAVEEVERQMSRHRRESDLERLNRAPLGVWQPVPAMLMEVLEAGIAIGEASGGTFDIGVGDLVRAWGFGAGEGSALTGATAGSIARGEGIAPKTLELDRLGGRVRRHAARTIDLSGIAKGYGVDRMARVAADFGVAAFLVGIDGEMRAHGRKPDGRAWAVGQEKPDPTVRELLGVVELVDAAVATSGDYRHFREIGGRRVSHTMDPRRGAPIAGDLVQATVIAPDCMTADAWATALMVAGLDDGEALARRRGLGAILVGRSGEVRTTL